MPTMNDYLKYAETAFAAYAVNLALGSKVNAAKYELSAGMSSTQALHFDDTWKVLAQQDLMDGFSAVLFQPVDFQGEPVGEKVLAIRGSEAWSIDWATDIVNIALLGSSFGMPQYNSLENFYQTLVAQGRLGASESITVTGHSLGGFLVQAFTAKHENVVSAAYTYNSPGFSAATGVLTNIGTQLLEFFGIVDASVPSDKVFNVRAIDGLSLTAGLGQMVGHVQGVMIEATIDPIHNHSIVTLTDSLALQAIFAQIDSTASVESITSILKAASADPATSLELTLDSLRTLFQQNYQYGHLDYDAVPTMVGNGATARNEYYTNLQSLETWWEASPLTALNIQPLAEYSGSQIATLAMADTADGQAYRYALYKLNPFAVTGSTVLYDGINAHGELNRYDSTTGTGNLTDLYLKDRAAMLSWLNEISTDDTQPQTGGDGAEVYSLPWSGTSYLFWDIEHTTRIHLGADAPSRRIIFGSDNADTLDGTSTHDHLYGGAGADALTGKAGNDYLEGGSGYDTYVVNAGDGYETVLDTDGAGVVQFGTVEAKGSAGIDPTKWIHSTGTDTWADTQNGITYIRSVVDGETRLLVKKGDSSAVLKGWSDGELGITLGTGAPLAPPPTVLTGTASGNYLDDLDTGSRKVEGQGGKDMIWGVGAADQLYGGDGDDWIMGNLGADYIEGGLGNDYITGLGGSAEARGGDGDDIITAASAEYMYLAGPRSGAIPGITGDIIWADVSQHWTPGYNVLQMYQDGSVAFQVYGGVAINSSFAGGSVLGGGWTYQFSILGGSFQLKYYHPTFASSGEVPAFEYSHEIYSGYVLASGVYLSGEAGADMLVGNNGDDVLSGGTGDDTLVGEDGHDILLGGGENDSLFGEAGNDVIDGGAGVDELFGGLGDDILDGGAGVDLLAGGSGDDTYLNVTGDDVINDTEGHGTILLATATGLGTGGLSVVNTGDQGQYRQLNVALDNGETLKLDDAFYGTSATIQFANGDELDLETLVGTTLATPVYLGLDNGGGRLYGGAEADGLYGGSGDDTLSGAQGDDSLFGGGGNDSLDGGLGDDSLTGGAGNDTYIVESTADIVNENPGEGTDFVESSVTYILGANVENLMLTGSVTINGTGNALKNILIGNDANNTLNGGGGADSMTGGLGDDTYFVGAIGDLVTEAANAGTDTVKSSITYTLGADVETLALIGTTAINGTGNGLANRLTGNAAVNILTGLDGNDILNGGAGADTLIGGTGNDIYVVDNVGDMVTENLGEGTDTVQSGISYSLGANIEKLTLTGTAAIDGTGNASANTILGNSGANSLSGGRGKDTLQGGKGNDTYVTGRGYGVDTVIENDATAGINDVVQFLSGVAADQIWFQKVGNNLEASIIGTSDKMVAKDWYLGTAYHVEQFKTADDTRTLLDSNVENLVNAMASFAPPAAGQTSLPTNYQDALAGVIAANWQ